MELERRGLTAGGPCICPTSTAYVYAMHEHYTCVQSPLMPGPREGEGRKWRLYAAAAPALRRAVPLLWPSHAARSRRF